LRRKREEADIAFHRVGITFAVYGEDSGKERLIPFDIIAAHYRGQRMEDDGRRLASAGQGALNSFLHDIYHDQEIIKAGRVSPRR
jgi:uncharacterized circularly permuted ATP-grasp superfamily protein